MKNIYKVSLVSGALVVTGATFAAHSLTVPTNTQNLLSQSSAAIDQSDSDKETNDDVNGVKNTSKDTDNIIDTGEKNGVEIKDVAKNDPQEKEELGTNKPDAMDSNKNDEYTKETKDDNITLPAKAITEDSAKKIALTEYPKATVVGVETESENGVIAYNISLNDGTDVKVDVQKGIIIKTDKRGNETKDGQKAEGKDKEVNND